MVEGLLRAGHRVTFVVRNVGANEHHRAGVTIIRLVERVSTKPVDGPMTLTERGLFRHLRETRPDVVIARNPSALSSRVFLMCRWLGIGFLLYIQARSGFEAMPVARRILLRVGLWPRHSINSACERPEREIRGKTFDFLPFAIAPGEHVKTDYTRAGPVRILCVAKLDQARKNLKPLVREVAPMIRDGRITLTLAGLRGGNNDHPVWRGLQDEIILQEIGQGIRILENLSFQESRKLYADHDLLVLPSSREPAAISPGEALASGIPVICGSDNGTNYLIREGQTGFVFADQDFEAMGGCVRYFLDRPDELERMGRAGHAMIVEDYSPEAWVRRFEDIVSRRLGIVA